MKKQDLVQDLQAILRKCRNKPRIDAVCMLDTVAAGIRKSKYEGVSTLMELEQTLRLLPNEGIPEHYEGGAEGLYTKRCEVLADTILEARQRRVEG